MGGTLRARSSAALVALAAAALLSVIVPSRPVPALADTTYSWLVSGGGWGHGLGMSQWGAKGYADQGWTATQIIEHFYSGTTVGAFTIPSSVRVGIAQLYRDITLIPSGDATFTSGSTTVATAHSGETWHLIAASDGRYALQRNNVTVAWAGVAGQGNTLNISWDWSSGTTVRIPDTGHTYRWGPMELNTYTTSSGYRLRSILVLAPFDRYLYGLGEVPSSWPAEALKAQVIAARTYAVNKIQRLGQNRADCNCAMYASTADQSYVGYDKETGSYGAQWVAAVNAVAGQVALYGGQPIQAYYASSDGGMTENNENVWGGSPLPYLRGVSDSGDGESPQHTWSVTLSMSAMQSKLDAFSDSAVGTLQNVETLAPYGVSGRVLDVIDSTHGGVRITGSTGVKRISGSRFEQILGLMSTKFTVSLVGTQPVASPAFTFGAGGQQGVWLAAAKVGHSPTQQVIVGTDNGSATVQTFSVSSDGVTRSSAFDAYPGIPDGVRVAGGDVDTSTANDEIVTAPGPRGGADVKIWTLLGGAHVLKAFTALPAWNGGLTVAAGDVDGAAPAEIVTGQETGGSRIQVWRYANGAVTLVRSFLAYGSFGGGVRVAVADVDGDGKAEIITVPSRGGAPDVRVWRGDGSLMADWTVEPGSGAWTGGAFVGAGDVNGDHKAEVFVGFDAGTTSMVKVFHVDPTPRLHNYFLAFGSFTNGVRLGAIDWSGDGVDDLLAGTGPNGSATIRVYHIV